MKNGERVTVVIAGEVDWGGRTGAFGAQLWCGMIDNDFTRLTGTYTSSDFIRFPPPGCFGFNAGGTLCYVREADEGTVWARGQLSEHDEAGAALLAAWHMGHDRVIAPWLPLPA